jgi:hypothetical protein
LFGRGIKMGFTEGIPVFKWHKELYVKNKTLLRQVVKRTPQNRHSTSGHWWLTPVILGTWETEISSKSALAKCS